MQLGPLQLTSNLFLSPLAGYTNLPFRLTLREVGGLGLATTDLVNARSLLEKNPKALKLIETSSADRPLAVQLFGSVPEEMRDAAVCLESLGVASVDINMGCPVRKVCRVGGGSAMPERAFCRSDCLGASGCCRRCWPGAASLNLRLGEPVCILTLGGGPLPAPWKP